MRTEGGSACRGRWKMWRGFQIRAKLQLSICAHCLLGCKSSNDIPDLRFFSALSEPAPARSCTQMKSFGMSHPQ